MGLTTVQRDCGTALPVIGGGVAV